MSQDAEEARELADRAGTQAKHAGRNAGRAAKAGAKAGAETVADEAREVADKVEGTVEDVVQTARKFDATVIKKLSGETIGGLLAFSVAVYSTALAYGKFRYVLGYAKGVAAARQQ